MPLDLQAQREVAAELCHPPLTDPHQSRTNVAPTSHQSRTNLAPACLLPPQAEREVAAELCNQLASYHLTTVRLPPTSSHPITYPPFTSPHLPYQPVSCRRRATVTRRSSFLRSDLRTDKY